MLSNTRVFVFMPSLLYLYLCLYLCLYLFCVGHTDLNCETWSVRWEQLETQTLRRPGHLSASSIIPAVIIFILLVMMVSPASREKNRNPLFLSLKWFDPILAQKFGYWTKKWHFWVGLLSFSGWYRQSLSFYMVNMIIYTRFNYEMWYIWSMIMVG